MPEEGEGQVRIGLTISGAIALGAYEGGALAALIAAAQAVNVERRDALRIDAMSGASAGSMTALLAAASLARGLDPVDVMYGAWVKAPQLEKLEDGLDSPLSVEATSGEAVDLLKGERRLDRAQEATIQVSMALGCLRGLEYRIGRISGPPVHASTYLDWSDLEIDGSRDVEWYVAPDGPVTAALASGAHAAAFPPLGLDRSAPDVQDAYERNGIEDFPSSKYLWYTDGGTIDNEPLGRALDITEALDETGDDQLGEGQRLHMMITPDPARPIGRDADDPWSGRTPAPTWARTGLRALTLVRSQHLYDDLRRVEKTNSRIEWVRRLETALLSIMNGETSDPVRALDEVTRAIGDDKRALKGGEDLRSGPGAGDSELAAALRGALGAATGLAQKRDIAVAVVSPVLLPEVADGSKTTAQLLAGDFLGHFGGFLDERLRENDFSLGYRSMLRWLETGGLEAQGLPADLGRAALAGANGARRPWREGLGKEDLDTRPWGQRLQVYRLALRAARIAFRQLSSPS